ncbi:MAG: tetratricopeptide repeat protein [Oscillatoriales cyanobacterium RM2_1_1]|nr:tetratricopeptide repeat protein [Oscillatoriales cyanobacterium RM2_1_1]
MNITILSTFVLVFLQTHFLQTHLLPVQFSSLPRGITPQGQIQAIPGGETPVISNETQKYIETEVQKAFQATLIVLSMLLILLILLPTIAAIATWFLLDKLARKSVWAEQEIESLSTDMIFQLETLLEEAKTLIQAAQNVSDYSGQFLNQSSNQSISATDEDTVNTIAIILESDQQGEILFLNGAAPNGAALNGNQAIEPEIKESGIREPEIELDIQDAGIEAPKIEALGTEQATIKQIVNNSQTDSLQLAKQYANQAEQLFLSHQLESAINAYDQAVQLDSKIAEVWNNRGVVLIKLQRYQAAIAPTKKPFSVAEITPMLGIIAALPWEKYNTMKQPWLPMNRLFKSALTILMPGIIKGLS